MHDLHRQAIGDEYPDGIEVTGSCTRGMLARALAGLRLTEGSPLATATQWLVIA